MVSGGSKRRAPTYKLKLRTVTVQVSEPDYCDTAEDSVRAAAVARGIFNRLGLDYDREHFIALHLDSRRRVIGFKVESSGTGGTCPVDPRYVFQHALAVGASALILVHNHPSLDPDPSRDDRALTRRFVRAGEVIGIRVLDHLIIVPPDPRHISLRQTDPSSFLQGGIL